jgi:hypothetical protein
LRTASPLTTVGVKPSAQLELRGAVKVGDGANRRQDGGRGNSAYPRNRGQDLSLRRQLGNLRFQGGDFFVKRVE